MNARVPEAHLHELAHGRSLAIDDDTLRVVSPEGEVEVEVLLTPDGPKLRVRARDLSVAASGDVNVRCRALRVRAVEGLTLATDGDLEATAAQDLNIRAGAHAFVDGRGVRVRGNRGNVELDAHDDVRANGERILLNS